MPIHDTSYRSILNHLARSMITRSLVSAVLTAAALSTTAANATDWSLVDQQLEQTIGMPDVGGCMVGAYQNGEVAFARGYGMAVAEHNIPLSADIKMDIGSISKQFTTLSALIAEQHGYINMQDEIHKYLPELPEYGADITLDMLAFHTNGIYPHFYVADFLRQVEVGVVHEHERLEQLSRFTTLNFPPGESWAYNNTGFLLLNIIIERTTGLTLREFSTHYIFKPLGMLDTFYYDNYAEVIPRMATGYSVLADGSYRKAPRIEDTVGAGGLLTTVNDFAKYQQNFEQPTIGKNPKALMKKLLQVGTSGDGQPLSNGYGYGMWHGKHQGHYSLSHGGTTEGFHSYYRRYPEDRFAVLISCNRDDISREEVINIVTGVRFDQDHGTISNPALVEQLATLADQFTGLYLNPDAILPSATVNFDGNSLLISTPLGVYRFVNANTNTANSFTFTSRDKAPSTGYEFDQITLSQPAPDAQWQLDYSSDLVPRAVLTQQQQYTPTVKEQKALVGNYQHRDTGICHRISLDNGVLMLDPGNGAQSIELKQESADLWFSNPAEFVRISKHKGGKVARYSFNQLLMRGIEFHRAKGCHNE